MTSRVNQRSVDGNLSDELDELEEIIIGEGATADAEDALAVGVGSSADHPGAAALGTNATAQGENEFSAGNRDYRMENNRSIVYPPDQGNQVLTELPIEDAPAGEAHYIQYRSGGQLVFEIRAEADGAGGVQNIGTYVPGDLAVDGDVTEVDDVVTGSVEVEDGTGNVQFLLDATTSPPTATFGGNVLDDVDRINPAGGDLAVDGDLNISGEVEEGSTL